MTGPCDFLTAEKAAWMRRAAYSHTPLEAVGGGGGNKGLWPLLSYYGTGEKAWVLVSHLPPDIRFQPYSPPYDLNRSPNLPKPPFLHL